MDQYTGEFRATRPNHKARPHRLLDHSRSQVIKGFLVGGGIILLIILALILWPGNGENAKAPLNDMKGDMDQLKMRVAQMEESVRSNTATAAQIKEIRQALSRLETSEKIIRDKQDGIIRQIAEFKKQMNTGTKDTRNASYHKVRPGENLFGIAKEYGLSIDELCRLNRIKPDQVIQPGQELIVRP